MAVISGHCVTIGRRVCRRWLLSVGVIAISVSGTHHSPTLMYWVFHHLSLPLPSTLSVPVDIVRPGITVQDPTPHSPPSSRTTSIPAPAILVLLALPLPLVVHTVLMALRGVVVTSLIVLTTRHRSLHVALLLVRHPLDSGCASGYICRGGSCRRDVRRDLL